MRTVLTAKDLLQNIYSKQASEQRAEKREFQH